MVSKNDVTGDKLRSKPTSQAYRDNYDKIFGKKTKETQGQEKVSTRGNT